MSAKPFSKLQDTLEAASDKIRHTSKAEGTGTVEWVKDGIVFITGMPETRMGERVEIVDAGVSALVLQLEQTSIYAAVLANTDSIKPGSKVARTNEVISIGVSQNILGRVVNPLGEPLDSLGSIESDKMMPLETPAPSVMDRKPVDTPMQTGIIAIDALVPIGRGQRELLIGDRQTGKTTIAIDTIINQKNQNTICVYVAIGQRDGKVSQVIRTLTDKGAMAYTTIVVASGSEPAAVQYLAPYAGSAIAEYFMHQGKDVLIVYDDLSKHAVSYRELSLLLRKPPGREAYPGDVFYIHSRLLERAARLSDEKGGGSITALPIIETQAADVSAYIPTNVISITDGQVFLEPKLFHKGIRPAINTGISVSRVGGSAQRKAIKKVAGKAKLYLAQYADLAAFAQFASELDEESKKQLTRGEKLIEILKQGPNQPYSLWQEVVLLWTAMNGHFDQTPNQEITRKVPLLLAKVESEMPNFIKDIQTKGDFSSEQEAELANLVMSFVKM